MIKNILTIILLATLSSTFVQAEEETTPEGDERITILGENGWLTSGVLMGIFKGTGSLTDNIDLETSEVYGNLGVNHLNSGTGATVNTYWRGDGAWAAVAGSGDVAGPGSSTDNTIVLFDGTSGTLIKESQFSIDNGLLYSNELLIRDEGSIALTPSSITNPGVSIVGSDAYSYSLKIMGKSGGATHTQVITDEEDSRFTIMAGGSSNNAPRIQMTGGGDVAGFEGSIILQAGSNLTDNFGATEAPILFKHSNLSGGAIDTASFRREEALLYTPLGIGVTFGVGLDGELEVEAPDGSVALVLDGDDINDVMQVRSSLEVVLASFGAHGGLSSKAAEVVKAATATLSSLEFGGVFVNNFGQAASSILTLPPLIGGENGCFEIAATSYPITIQTTSEALWLDGTDTIVDAVENVTPSVGDEICCKTGRDSSNDVYLKCKTSWGSGWQI